MRVLLTTPAGIGHLHPMVPLARALVDRAHEVRWALPEAGAAHEAVREFDVVPIAGCEGASVAEVMRRFPELQALPPESRPEALFGKLFGALAAPPMLAGLEPFAREWRPDLVVADAADFAGHLVAALLGVPSVTKGFGGLLPKVRVARAGEEVAPLWIERGLEPRPYGGAYDTLYLDIFPPELTVEDDAHVPRRQLLQPVAPVAGGRPPTVAGTPAEGPLVYVTMGTVFNEPAPLRRAVDGVAALPGPLRVLATVGPAGDPTSLGDQPRHVRVERYVPQAELLPACAVVVSHAGSGTMLGALSAGVPQLCLPQGADQFLNAAAVVRSGAGLAIGPGEATADAVGAAVATLMKDSGARSAAGRVAASIAAMPSPDEVVGILETLV